MEFLWWMVGIVDLGFKTAVVTSTILMVFWTFDKIDEKIEENSQL